MPFLFEFAFFFFFGTAIQDNVVITSLHVFTSFVSHGGCYLALSPQYVRFNAWCLCTFPSGRPRPTVGGLAVATVKSTLFIDAFLLNANKWFTESTAIRDKRGTKTRPRSRCLGKILRLKLAQARGRRATLDLQPAFRQPFLFLDEIKHPRSLRI